MSEADKMFKKLGYKLKTDERETIQYIKDDDTFFVFSLQYKFFSKFELYKYSGEITMEELQAINEKVKELGWIWKKLLM